MQNFVELKYIEKYKIIINEEKDDLFYFFDYDVRTYDVNMEFQHFHNFYEIMIPLDDKISHIIEGRYYDLKKYDIILLKPSRLHKSKYHQGRPRKRLIINFNIPFNMFGLSNDLKKVLSLFDKEIPIFRFNLEERQTLFNFINEIFSIHYKKMSASYLFIHSKFLEFLYFLYLKEKENKFEVEFVGNSITQKIYDISSYIHLNLEKDLYLEAIAEKFSISPCYLSHQFKTITGFNLVNYIQMTRVREVQSLLINSNKQIKEISEECGFTSFSQFNRVFRKYVNKSPSQFRKNGSDELRNMLRFKTLD